MCIYSRSIIESVSEQKWGVRGRVEISEGNTTRPWFLVFVEYNERRRQHNFAAALTINNTFRLFTHFCFCCFCLWLFCKQTWKTAKRRGWKDLHIVRLSCRALLFIQLIIRWLSQPIKQKTGPISKTFLQGWRVWTADFGGRLVKLGVPWRGVGADGEIVWANASCSPSVPVFSPSPELLSFS